MRKFAALAVGTFLLASLAACSSTSTTSSSGTTAAPTTTAAGGKTATTAKGKSTGSTIKKAPPVTKPPAGSKVDKAKVPAKAQKAEKVSGLSTDESDCLDYLIVTTLESSDPADVENEAYLIGVTGASMVACIPLATLAAGSAAILKEAEPSITEAQQECIQKEISTAPEDDVIAFMGALVIGNAEIINQAATYFNEKCGTKFT